ncbi:LysR substrate-binding domain-containing protein [Cereibacter sp. SYSU M97828]|nr:LysR substrate-binding domain-containing protein [Cereibacter flavus]
MSLRVPVATLRIFDAAARHQSFKAAALELSLTPSAVSHAVKRMEDSLGVPLFERSGRSLLLTPSGEALKAHTDRAFEELRVGLEMVSARRPQILRLHCAPSFAANWLTPRLSRFIAQHPEVELRLSAGVDYARFDTDEFDADIIYGPPRQKGLEVMPLCEEIVTPLCSPAMAERIKAVGDLLQQPLIQSEFKQVRWPEWFELNGIPRPSLPQGSRFDRSFLALTAAANGLGVALESTLLAETEIASGKLVQPLEGSTRPISYIGHHLVHPHAFRTRAPLRLFKEWIRAELRL